MANTASPGNVPNIPAGPARKNDKILKYALWVAAVLFTCLMGLLFLLMIIFKTQDAGLIGILVGISVATVPVPLYLALALWIDRYEKEPIWMLVGAFVWGVVVADTLSFFLNSINSIIVGELVGPGAAEFFTAVISAPIVEEGSKGIALFLLYWWKKDEFDGVMDGIIYAAMVGLGFAMAENFGYYGRFYEEGGAELLLGGFVLRGVIGAFGHPIFTAMTGIGLGLARGSRQSWVKVTAPIVGLLLAMMLHSFWNFAALVIDALVTPPNATLKVELLINMVTSLVLTTPLLIGILVVIIFALRREAQIIRHYLTPELQNGLITHQQYDSLGSVLGRINSSFHALGSGGRWRAYSRFSQTATELAFHRDRVSRGITSVDAAQREAAYVRVLQELRRTKG